MGDFIILQIIHYHMTTLHHARADLQYLKHSSNDLKIVLQSLYQSDFSKNTFIAMSADLKHFFSWYEATNGEAFNFARVLPRDIIDFRTACQRKGLLPATINRRLTHVRIFFKHALERKIIASNPTRGIKSVAQQTLSPKGLTDNEARKLIKEVELVGNLRDLCLIEFMLSAGLRASEVVAIKREHLTLTERKGTLIISKAKGNKTRTIPLSKRVREVIEKLLDQKAEKIHAHEGFIFIGQRGVLTTLATNKIVQKYAKKTGLKCSPHTLRHTFAYRYLKANPSDIVGLSQILGHSNINTTAIYTQHRMEELQLAVEGMS